MGVLKLMPTHCYIPTLIQPMTNLPIPHPSVMEFSNLRIKKSWYSEVGGTRRFRHLTVTFKQTYTLIGIVRLLEPIPASQTPVLDAKRKSLAVVKRSPRDP